MLRPDGLFLAAFAGAGSLPRLRSALRAGEEALGGSAAPRIHPQIDVRAAGDLLGRAGFALPVVDVETVVVRFPTIFQLIADLRGMGATNILSSRPRRLWHTTHALLPLPRGLRARLRRRGYRRRALGRRRGQLRLSLR